MIRYKYNCVIVFMEKRLNKHINDIIANYNDSLTEILSDQRTDSETKIKLISELPKMAISIDDVLKKRRVRNTVSDNERCCAYRATGERCTRKKKDGCDLCGTHIKGTPHGCINATNIVKEEENFSKITVETRDVNGIVYYVDKENNVYSSIDIMKNMVNPQIIGKLTQEANGTFYVRSV